MKFKFLSFVYFWLSTENQNEIRKLMIRRRNNFQMLTDFVLIFFAKPDVRKSFSGYEITTQLN